MLCFPGRDLSGLNHPLHQPFWSTFLEPKHLLCLTPFVGFEVSTNDPMVWIRCVGLRRHTKAAALEAPGTVHSSIKFYRLSITVHSRNTFDLLSLGIKAMMLTLWEPYSAVWAQEGCMLISEMHYGTEWVHFIWFGTPLQRLSLQMEGWF